MLPEIRTIVYATDLSPQAPETFRYAMSLAHKYDAKIVLVYAVEPLPPMAKSLVSMYLPEGEPGEDIPKAVRERLFGDIRGKLQHFCTDEVCVDLGGHERVSEICIREGHAAEIILAETARVEADLVIMGAHGHSALGELVLGSVSHQVLQRCPVPVLIVRHPKSG